MSKIVFVFLAIASFLGAGECSQYYIFQTPPDHFHPKIEASGCHFVLGQRQLFLKRQSSILDGGTWGVPGGKLEKGESPKQAVMREVREETGIDLQPDSIQFLRTVYVRYPEMDFIYHMFQVALDDLPQVTIDPHEHVDFRWMTLDEALTLPLIRGEDECLKLLYSDHLFR
jgi:8-oxo-dGTP pyrophosphatase MutT (NUDIX family)